MAPSVPWPCNYRLSIQSINKFGLSLLSFSFSCELSRQKALNGISYEGRRFVDFCFGGGLPHAESKGPPRVLERQPHRLEHVAHSRVVVAVASGAGGAQHAVLDLGENFWCEHVFERNREGVREALCWVPIHQHRRNTTTAAGTTVVMVSSACGWRCRWEACFKRALQPVAQSAEARFRVWQPEFRYFAGGAEPSRQKRVFRAGSFPAFVAGAEQELLQRGRAALAEERADAFGGIQLVPCDGEVVHSQGLGVDFDLA
mmetsp:Transcript_50142/g.93213  ORF Transcript_50142/g.93213 Transcript_50142/m.93213 type:complete len:258 (+) Transcript_50142:82-855(+)